MKSLIRVTAKAVLVLGLLEILGRCGTTTGTYANASLIVQGTPPGSVSSSGVMKAARNLISGPVSITVKDRSGATQGTISIDTAEVALKEFKFLFAESDLVTQEQRTQNSEIKLRGPYLVDLLTNTSRPALDKLQLIKGIYKQVEFKLAKLEGTEVDTNGMPLVTSSDPMFGNSLYLAGTYNGTLSSGNYNGPFSVSYDFDEDFQLSPAGASPRGMQVTDAAPTLIIAFRMARWFRFDSSVNDKSVDFSQAVLTNGVLKLDHDSNGARGVASTEI